MAVAAKVIETVRLGLVDIEVLIRELNTRGMQRLPDIQRILFDASIYFHVPSQVPRFAEKSKPRTSSQVLLAIIPDSPAVRFDVVTKGWKDFKSMRQPKLKGDTYYAAELVSNHLYVAVKNCSRYFYLHCYNIDRNLWEEQPRPPCAINNLCAIGEYIYAVGDYGNVPQRYNSFRRQWQPIAELSDFSKSEHHCYAGATVFDSKLYVIYGRAQITEKRHLGPRSPDDYSPQKALLCCFHPQLNYWELVSNTCLPHFDSTLFVVNNKLCVAGGKDAIWISYREVEPHGNTASVEVYNFDTRTWSIVRQNHIPSNNLGAIEVEGRVYFIINKFPIDSGIRIPSGEVYPVHLGEWENLARVGRDALLRYLPIKN